MKRLLFLIAFLGTISSIWAQTEENLFVWKTGNSIVAKTKFLSLLGNQGLPTNIPIYTFKEYNLSSGNKDTYVLKIRGVGNEDLFTQGGFDFFEIYHMGKMILRYHPYSQMYDVRYVTAEVSKDYFVKIPLSNDSFALLFGGCLFGDGDTPEMVIIVVSGDNAKVVFDSNGYAYKYTSGESFSIEYVDDINGLYAIGSSGFTEDYLKQRTKYKIWKEGNMLKYKSWK